MSSVLRAVMSTTPPVRFRHGFPAWLHDHVYEKSPSSPSGSNEDEAERKTSLSSPTVRPPPLMMGTRGVLFIWKEKVCTAHTLKFFERQPWMVKVYVCPLGRVRGGRYTPREEALLTSLSSSMMYSGSEDNAVHVSFHPPSRLQSGCIEGGEAKMRTCCDRRMIPSTAVVSVTKISASQTSHSTPSPRYPTGQDPHANSGSFIATPSLSSGLLGSIV